MFQLGGCLGLVATLLIGCGSVHEPEYVSYSPALSANQAASSASPSQTASPQATAAPDNAQCIKDATALYNSNVASAVDKTCSSASCHGNQKKLKLAASAVDANRAALKDYSGDLATYIYGASHSGGDQSSALAKSSLVTWLTAEKKCK